MTKKQKEDCIMKKSNFKIFVVNPGSTSTKVALFRDKTKEFEMTITHDASKLNSFPSINDQLDYRMEVVHQFIETNHIDLTDVDAFVGRGGACYPVESGVYEVNDRLVEDMVNAVGGVQHPSNIGIPMAKKLQEKYGGRLFMIDPVAVDEFSPVSRITGVKGIERKAISHALNLKGTAMHHCKLHGLDYKNTKLVVAHIDGGITIAAHDHGRQVDCNDGAGGDGPFTGTRTGSLPLLGVLDYLHDHTEDELRKMCAGYGGFVSYFGTSNADEVLEMAKEGNEEAQLVWTALAYNIVKFIGSMAAALKGEIDGILLTGRYTRFEGLMKYIKEHVGWIAPIYIYENEVEHEAMASGALRVLRGEEEAKEYKGKSGFVGTFTKEGTAV